MDTNKELAIRKPKTKSDYAYNVLRQKILSRELQPGTALNVQEIAKMLDISEIPVREALKQLNMQRLVNIKSHVGAFVNEYSIKEIEDNLAAREILEPIITGLSVPHINSHQIKELYSIIKKMEKIVETGNYYEYAGLNRQFHKKIYSACPNIELQRIIFELWDMCDWALELFAIVPERLHDSIIEHKNIVEAIEDGNWEKAIEITRTQKVRSFKRYLENMKKPK